VPTDALALALGAAVLHALWNVLLARTRDPQAATAAAFCLAVLIWAPVAAATWRIEAGAWKYIAASAAFELAYVLLLSAAYVHAPLSVFYPIARGLAPVFVLVVAVLALGAATSWNQALGVCAVGAGILLVRGRRPDRSATVFGLSIAATIAGYTLIDNTGVTLADPLAYLEAVMIGPALVTAAVVAVRQGRPALRAGFRRETLLIAPLTLAPYALTLYALRLAPAAPVAAVRETSVLFVTVLAAVMLKERVSPWRAAGAAVVVVGVILLVV
jgi:drug/metabolite transporter (DMT)-like permease